MEQEEVNPYRDRNRNLFALGFESYDEYLRSDLWKTIRSRRLAAFPQCIACGRKSRTLHHASYDIETLSGRNLDALMPSCSRCHKTAEKKARKIKNGSDRLQSVTLFLLSGNGLSGSRKPVVRKEKRSWRKQVFGNSATWRTVVNFDKSILRSSAEKVAAQANRIAKARKMFDPTPRLVRCPAAITTKKEWS